MARECIVKISANGLFLNENLHVHPKATNLPLEQLAFKNNTAVYWLVEQLYYNKESQRLIVTVKDYFFKAMVDDFCNQMPKLPIRHVQFQDLRGLETLQQAIAYYQKFLTPHYQAPAEVKEQDIDYSRSNKAAGMSEKQLIFVKTIKVYFKDAYFKNGFITTEQFVPEVDKNVIFEVENSNVLAEYEYIKSYFAKVLKKKQFTLQAKITVNDEVVEVVSESPELEKIDQKMIESVKQLRTKDLLKAGAAKKPDKALFSPDEIFDTLDQEFSPGNIFKQSENDILRFMLDIKNVRNRKQLEFLAGKLQSDKMKLKFTMYPHFGFLFLIEGEEMNHFCWELLNSHATYVWSINKTAKLHLQIKRVERIINTIRNTGRQQYRQAYLHQSVDDDVVFQAINHDSISSNFVEGFAHWKHKLLEMIV